MTTETPYAGEDPHQLLGSVQALARQVRRAQRATWFPLLVLAAVTLAAIPVNRYGPHAITCRGVSAGGRVCAVSSPAALVYWPIALVAAYLAVAAFFEHRSRAVGLASRVRPYVTAGILVALVLCGTSLWAAHHPLAGDYNFLALQIPGDVLYRLASGAGAIGLALLVLAGAERSRALLLVTLGYLAVVLVPIGMGSSGGRPSPWAFLPRLVIQGAVLLVGAAGFARAQRPLRRPAG